MINAISKLKGFGIFSDFNCTDTTVRPFKRFNLIYGWNGSGKSTLTKVFACLEKKKVIEDFSESNFTLKIKDQIDISEKNIESNNLNVRVFNEDFIADNIQWNSDKSAKSILILSEEKIEEKKKLDDLKVEITRKENEVKNEGLKITVKLKSKDAFLAATAKTIKEAFKIIDTSDTHYFNYNKTKLEAFINSQNKELKLESSILNEIDLKTLTTSIKPISKPNLDFIITQPDKEKILEAEKKIIALVSTSLVNESIKRLETNPDIQTWVEAGIEIHNSHKSEDCEYCGQKIPKQRIEELEKHFNEGYKTAIIKIESAIKWINDLDLSLTALPDASAVYEEFTENYLNGKSGLQQKYFHLTESIVKWKEKLEEKKLNPFGEIIWKEKNITEILNSVSTAIKDVEKIQEMHNAKTNDFAEVLKLQKSRLELHYAAESIKENKFFNSEKEIETLNIKYQALAGAIKVIQKEAYDLSKDLTDEVKGAADFNKLLHSFLGREDISLHFIEEEKGYKILRKGSTKAAKNLSEGEKTAIAFIYFIIKLKENGNNIQETIVVIDDPVSSLDSNHLIHAYSFLKSHCTQVKQLFVLTHNFNFFKLIRDWIFYVKPDEGDKNYYTIDSFSLDEKRQSSIVNANNFLLKYNSEYHYLFYKINAYSKRDDLLIDDMYIIANLSRRFIESLITFKYPKKEKDIWEKFKKIDFDEVKKTKVYKFINLYSHNDKIESHEGFGDNIFGEGKQLVETIMEFIETIDKAHYDELLSISNN